LARFRARLRELGYVERKSILIEERYAEGNAQRLKGLVQELAASNVEVIVASAVAATTAARQATNTIPIVLVHAGKAVGAGLITSLARPGGNVTGTTNLPLGGKPVDLIREFIPQAIKLAVLANPTNAGAAGYLASVTDAAARYNIGVIAVEVTRVEDFPAIRP
jgi:putative ABC transport system substrate-binding protein